jgi:uncharacterized membrane-anchored protein
MVILVNDLETVKMHYENYSQFVKVFYKTYSKENVEYIKIIAGQLGWEGKLNEELKKWLEEVKAVEVKEAIPDELFFMR